MKIFNFIVLLCFTWPFLCSSIAGDECRLAPLALEPRIESRTYPSVFSAWGGIGWSSVLNQIDKPDIDQIAQHDLWLNKPRFGLRFTPSENTETGNIMLVGNIAEAQYKRNEFVKRNPSMIFIIEIRMRTHPLSMFPENSPFWIRDADGNRTEEGLTDFTHPGLQDIIVQKAISVAQCGLYDGVFFDWWFDQGVVLADRATGWRHGYRGLEAERQARKVILERIRNATRPDFLIMVNNNRRTLPFSAQHINGTYMETLIPREQSGESLDQMLREVETTLLWSSNNLRRPHINATEGWGIPHIAPDNPRNLQWMRVFTCLTLTHSDAYTLFIANYNKKHYWYDFWDADLGRPVGEKGQLYQETDGLYIREFTNGWAVYNHSGEAQVITLPEEAQGVASGRVGAEHTLPNLDGEMYLRMKPENPADVNGDGVVNILDLVAVAQAFGKDGLQGDVNGDGVVNVFDLVQVAGAIGGGGAAPSAYSPDPSIISVADLEKWLALAGGLGIGDANFQRGIRFLESLLAALTPKETTLLPNYPNPFNPETWIPYHLAREAEVAITIYDTKGTLVRRLALGNQAAGYYAERDKAAYWDGRNERGEAVASGIYIYQFRAGDYAASRRMVIVK